MNVRFGSETDARPVSGMGGKQTLAAWAQHSVAISDRGKDLPFPKTG
jgi:hypothetical protein